MSTRSARGLALAAILQSAPAFAAPSYTVIDIGVADDSADPSVMQAMGLNSLGEVTGYYTNADGHQHAFLYTHGIVRDLGTLGGSYSVGIAVNDSSEVTGSSRPSDSNSDEHAFLHNGVFMDDLGTLGGAISQGVGINASGEVTARPT
jgi:probable HAF family extracellular repeat protein